MRVIKNGFTVKIEGKCTTEYDILTLWNFGYTVKSLVNRFAKDNKMKKTEADKYVTDILYKRAMKTKDGGKDTNEV